MATKPTITVIGSLNIDLVTYTPRLPGGGETLTASGFNVGLGGKGANQAVACAKVSRTKANVKNGSVNIRMVGAVGDDSYGPMMTAGLATVGVDVSGISTRPTTKTGVAVIIVEGSTGENRIMLSPEANSTVLPDQFSSLSSPLPDLLILQLEIPVETVLQILIAAHNQGVGVLFNPAPAARIPDKYYAAVTHLIMNESEAAILSGCSESELESAEGRDRIAQSFQEFGVKNVLITLGGQGVHYSSTDGKRGHVVAEKVTVVDTTAAGDTFVGVYALEAIKEDFDIERAVEIANRAASKTVGRKGAQESIPWQDELVC